MDNALVIGLGEVGRAVHQVLLRAHNVHATDKEKNVSRGGGGDGRFDFLHICIPYSDTFKGEVRWYQRQYGGLTVIHSTVPVGTSAELEAVHSPIIGLHPDLELSLFTFTKFVGGPGASDVARHLMRCGVRCYTTDKSETTELMKLLSTTFYGLCIEWTKTVKQTCVELGVPFELWTLWTHAYNEGYCKLGHPEFTRPLLIPLEGQIGGHCVLPNLDLLGLDLLGEGDFVTLIKRRNAED